MPLSLRHLLLALMLALVSAALPAAEKNYSVRAPDGVRIAVQESGNPAGPPIIFIHAAHRWLRTMIAAVCREMDTPPAASPG